MITDITNAIASLVALFAAHLSRRSLRRAEGLDTRMSDLSAKIDALNERLDRLERRKRKRDELSTRA